MKVKSESEVAQSGLTLSDPMDCSPPGSSIHGIPQARVLEWVAIAFSFDSKISIIRQDLGKKSYQFIAKFSWPILLKKIFFFRQPLNYEISNKKKSCYNKILKFLDSQRIAHNADTALKQKM